MKKRLITILSLILAFVLCFTLVACGGDDKPNGGKPNGDKEPPEEPSVPTVSVTLNQALNAIEDVLTVQGFTGAASYTVSTKNSKPLTDSVTLDKRGNKLKITAGSDEHIVDLNTGYVYRSGKNGYTFDHMFSANVVGYMQYVVANLDKTVGAKDIKAVYDEEKGTLTYVIEKSENVNKYIAPLQSAYKNNKKIGALLDDYCALLFGKSFNDMYKVAEDYIADSENTVGTLLDALKEKGLDVEAILEMTGYGLPDDQMRFIKARPLNQVVAGAVNYLVDSFGNMLPFAEDGEGDDDDTSSEVGGGMQSIAIELLNAMLFGEVTEKDIETAMKSVSALMTFVKTFDVRAAVDMALANAPEAADLYTVVKDGVTLKNATVTLTLTVNDDKTIKGVKVDCLAAHTYTGKAAEGSLLADNDYRATAELTIDEYKTTTDDFVITLDPACDYRKSVSALLYEVTDQNVSVYYETAGKTVTVSSYVFEVETPDGETNEILSSAKAFYFDAETSSFVFDKEIIYSVFNDAAFGTTLTAYVFFDGDDYNGYGIILTYVNADMQDLKDYARESFLAALNGFIGGGLPEEPDIGYEEIA